MALEEAGELEEAARVFEFAGEHAQAAALRLEHANTLRDQRVRLNVLREGCARNRGETSEGRALHLALADALLLQTQNTTDTAAKRALHIEAAQALDEAQEGERAGQLYESLGLLQRAARAYERAGAIAPLEVVLEVLERREQAAGAQRELEHTIDRAIRQGRREQARKLLADHLRPDPPGTPTPRPALAQRLAHLEDAQPRARKIDFRLQHGGTVKVRGGEALTIGRAPEVDVPVPLAGISRHHALLRIDERARLVLEDAGSKAGTFWLEDPLDPSESLPLQTSGQIGLGFAASIQVQRLDDVLGALLQIPSQPETTWLYVPRGGRLRCVTGHPLPARISFAGDAPVLTADRQATLQLGDEPLGAGARVELLIGDRLRLTSPAGDTTTLEVLA